MLFLRPLSVVAFEMRRRFFGLKLSATICSLQRVFGAMYRCRQWESQDVCGKFYTMKFTEPEPDVTLAFSHL